MSEAFAAVLRPNRDEVAIFVRAEKPGETGPCAVLSLADARTLHATLGGALALAAAPERPPAGGDAALPLEGC